MRRIGRSALIVALLMTACSSSRTTTAGPPTSTTQSTGPSNSHVTTSAPATTGTALTGQAIAAVRTGDRTGWVLEPGGLRRTTVDGGSTWEVTPVPGADGRRFGEGQLFVDGPDAWVVTGAPSAGSVTVTRVHEGTRVSTVALPGSHPTANSASVAFIDADHGWAAVGADQGSRQGGSDLYATNDGGQTWRELGRAPFDGPLHPVDANLGFALGSSLWRSDDGGKSWRIENTPHPDSGLPSWFPRLSLFGSRGRAPDQHRHRNDGLRRVRRHEGRRSDLGGAPAPVDAGFNNTGPPLTFSVTDPDHWHVAQGGRLWATSDGGRSWDQIHTDFRKATSKT